MEDLQRLETIITDHKHLLSDEAYRLSMESLKRIYDLLNIADILESNEDLQDLQDEGEVSEDEGDEGETSEDEGETSEDDKYESEDTRDSSHDSLTSEDTVYGELYDLLYDQNTPVRDFHVELRQRYQRISRINPNNLRWSIETMLFIEWVSTQVSNHRLTSEEHNLIHTVYLSIHDRFFRRVEDAFSLIFESASLS